MRREERTGVEGERGWQDRRGVWRGRERELEDDPSCPCCLGEQGTLRLKRSLFVDSDGNRGNRSVPDGAKRQVLKKAAKSGLAFSFLPLKYFLRQACAMYVFQMGVLPGTTVPSVPVP